MRQIVIREQFQTDRGDVLHVRLQVHPRTVFGRCVALGEIRAVLLRQILLSADRLGIERERDDLPLWLRLTFHLLFPVGQLLTPIEMLGLQFLFDAPTLFEYVFAKLLLFGRVNRDGGLVGIVQEGEHPIVIVLRKRIVFVAVALAALNRQPEHRLADGVHAIEHRFHAELLGVDAPFLVDHRIPQEPRGDDLFLSRLR